MMPKLRSTTSTLTSLPFNSYKQIISIICLSLILTATAAASPYIVKVGRSPLPQDGEVITNPFPARRLMPAESEREPAPSPGDVVPWYKAPLHLGRTITIEGHIERANDIGNITFLNFTDKFTNDFTVVCFRDMYESAPFGKPEQAYKNKTLQVTGRVTMYNGKPQIELREGGRIKIVGSHRTPKPAGFVTPNIVPPPTVPKGDLPIAKNAIAWDQAKYHIGKKVTIQGKVVAAKNLGTIAFLNFDTEWKGKFSVVVFGSVFPDIVGGNPETAFLGKNIQVKGTVTSHKNTPQIEVRKADQIVILDPTGKTQSATRKSSQQQTAPGTIPWNEAKNHVGKTITVSGKVVLSKDIGSRCFLNFDRNYRGKFTVTIPKSSYNTFPDSKPWLYYKDKNISITGKVTTHRGAPQMEVTSASQIKVNGEAQGVTTGATDEPILWSDTQNFVGKEITVKGTVLRTKDIGSRTFINFSDDFRNTFTIVVPKSSYSQFPNNSPADYFNGNLVHVTGKVTTYRNVPQMNVTKLEQVTIK